MSQNLNLSELEKKIAKLEKENSNLNYELKRIKDTYNNTTVGLYRTNPQGEILMANKPLIKLMGFKTFSELQNYNLNNHDLISEAERKEFQKTIEKEGIVIGREAVWLTKNGEEIYIRESSKAIKDENGKTIFYEGTVEDITREKQKEKELKEIELKYKRLVQILPNGVVIHKNEDILYANEYARNTIRASSKGSLAGKKIFNYIHPDYHKITQTRIEKCLTEFTKTNLAEQILLTEQGTPIHVEIITLPYIQDNEIYLLSVFSDISDRKHAEKELKLSEVTYRGMLNSISEAIFIQDYNGKFIDVNKAAERLFGYRNEFFHEKDPRDLESEGKNDYDEIYEKIQSAYNGKRETLEFWGMTKDGEEFPAEVSLGAGTYFDKRVVIAVLRDITERKKSEAALKTSELKYRQLINFAVGGILIGTHDGYIIEANTYMYKILGRKRKDIIGKHITDGIFTKESLEKTPLNFEALKKGRTIISVRTIIRPDGSTLPVEMHTKMMPDGTYQSIYHDISERQKTEREILEAKSKAESLNLHKDALLSALPDILFTFDSKGNIIDFYSNTQEQLLVPPEKFLNKDISLILPSEIASLTKEQISKVLKTKKLSNFQYKLSINNTTDYFDAKMVYFKENTVLTVIRNISERMNLISDLQNARKKAEESDKLKSAFLSNLSHEIRTPMNGILGFTELLKDDISKEEKLEYLDIIENSCNQLLLILDDIIEISKIEAGIIKKKIESIRINAFVKDLHTQMKGLFSKSKNVNFILDRNLPVKNIEGITDSVKLKQILSNFISNAYKFTENGEVVLGYELISDSYIKFYVKDTGIGISNENLDKIFNRFVQIDNSLVNISRGSGLGLSICQAYAEILGGTINVESELGNGSTFSLEIPLLSFS